MGHLLTISGQEDFKAPSYYRAARQVKGYGGDLEALLEEGGATKIPGIGPALEAKMREIKETGSFRALDSLRDSLPSDVLGLIDIPGIGARTAGRLYRGLGVENPSDLDRALQSQRVRTLPGLGPKKETQLKEALESHFRRQAYLPLYRAQWLGRDLASRLEGLEEVLEARLSGRVRRGWAQVETVGLVVILSSPGEISLPGDMEIPPVVNLVYTHPKIAGLTWLQATGSRDHLKALEERARELGLTLERPEQGKGDDSGWLGDEARLYERLGLDFIPPEIRETGEEVTLALEGRLPSLVGPAHFRGDLHLHTTWSDGSNTLEDMVQEAQDLGYEYLAVTDHSQSLAIAGGLDPRRLKEQGRAIGELEETLGGIRILRGSEVDILNNGTLDFDQEILSDLDLVIGSIHNGFSLPPQQQTRRLEEACRHPHVDIIAHPSGRVLGYREGYGANLDRLIQVAAETGTALEINATPDRMDLGWEEARRAADAGVLLAINTDAHSRVALGDLSFGITVARKAWLEPDQILNTWPQKRLEEWLKRPKPERARRDGTG